MAKSDIYQMTVQMSGVNARRRGKITTEKELQKKEKQGEIIKLKKIEKKKRSKSDDEICE